MLSRVNRISRGEDFRATVRRGRKSTSSHSVVYVLPTTEASPARFGFIVSKGVGNSVVRHFVTRRLRAVGYELLPAYSSGLDVIVRALPGADEVDWAVLRDEIGGALRRQVEPRNAQTGAGA